MLKAGVEKMSVLLEGASGKPVYLMCWSLGTQGGSMYCPWRGSPGAEAGGIGMIRSQPSQAILRRLGFIWKAQGAFEGLEIEEWAPSDLRFRKTAVVAG